MYVKVARGVRDASLSAGVMGVGNAEDVMSGVTVVTGVSVLSNLVFIVISVSLSWCTTSPVYGSASPNSTWRARMRDGYWGE
jgi:hypothetical protein